jgi:hypothetical protein
VVIWTTSKANVTVLAQPEQARTIFIPGGVLEVPLRSSSHRQEADSCRSRSKGTSQKTDN